MESRSRRTAWQWAQVASSVPNSSARASCDPSVSARLAYSRTRAMPSTSSSEVEVTLCATMLSGAVASAR